MARADNTNADAVRFSTSIALSKRNNFFIAGYHPLSDTVKIKQNDGIIIFDSAFVERAWRIDTSTLYLLSKKIPIDNYNLIINYSEYPLTNELHFDLTPLNDSSTNAGVVHYGNKILLHRLPQLPDTIWFRLMEKNNDSLQSWMESDELVGFIKK